MILDGTAIPVKQCMPEGMEIDVETVDFNNDEQTSPAFRAKRFLGILTVSQLPTPRREEGAGQYSLKQD